MRLVCAVVLYACWSSRRSTRGSASQVKCKQELKQLEKTINDKRSERGKLLPKYQKSLEEQEQLEKEYVDAAKMCALRQLLIGYRVQYDDLVTNVSSSNH